MIHGGAMHATKGAGDKITAQLINLFSNSNLRMINVLQI
jgi:hypothetical protein